MNKYLKLYHTHSNKILPNTDLVQEILDATKDLPIEFVHIKQRLWHLAYNINNVPLCSVCKVNTVKWDKKNSKYPNTCGYKCSTKQTANNPAIKLKKEKTNIERYGGKAPANSDVVIQKANNTKIQRYGAYNGDVWKDKIESAVYEKYGVDNISRLPEVKVKQKAAWASKSDEEMTSIVNARIESCQRIYNANNPMQCDDIKAKAINTLKNNWGVEYPGLSAEIRAKIEETNLARYGYRTPSSNPIIKQKVTDSHLKKYGVKRATLLSNINKKAQDTNFKKYGCRSHSQVHIPTEVLTLMNNVDWLTNQHHVNLRPITDIAAELNINSTTMCRIFDKLNIAKITFSRSAAERHLSEWLHSSEIVHQTNTKSIITPWELDIFIPSHNMAIEYCGLYWHCSYHDRIKRNYHKNKLTACQAKGIRLITIFEDEWLHNRNIVEAKLKSILKISTEEKIHARKCTVISLNTKQKNEFFEKHHIQGSGPGSLTYGLTHNGEVVAAMTFIKQANNVYVLNRYATCKQINGGFSKLLTHFKNNNGWNQIISFADQRWSEGTLYEKNGFVLDKTLPPDYEYVDLVSMKRIHKFNFRHKNLPNILGENYDPNLSETENTRNNGWYKIYNCGLLRYVMNF